MINTGFILNLLFAHFAGDWWLQSRRMDTNKSTDLIVLLKHLVIVTLCLAVPVLLYVPSLWYMLFANAIIHGIIDWNIWKQYKYSTPPWHEYWKDKKFYDIIGVDQLLHLWILTLLFL